MFSFQFIEFIHYVGLVLSVWLALVFFQRNDRAPGTLTRKIFTFGLALVGPALLLISGLGLIGRLQILNQELPYWVQLKILTLSLLIIFILVSFFRRSYQKFLIGFYLSTVLATIYIGVYKPY